LDERQDLAEAASAAEVALLRSSALALAEAEVTGTPLPAPLAADLAGWLQGDWQPGEERDREFAQGYLAALEAAARQCEAMAERRLAEGRRRWNPLRRSGGRRAASMLQAMADNLRLMARGIRPQGR
jgi:hypothetical protein